MKKILFALCFFLGSSTLNAQVVYEHTAPGPGGYLAFPPAAGAFGADDYTMDAGVVPAGSVTCELADFSFVGGVDVANSDVQIDFFDAGGALVNSITVTLPQAGPFVWGPIPLGPGFIVPVSGIVQLSSVTPGTSGEWFLTDGGPTVGTTDDALPGAAGPGGAFLNHTMTLTCAAFQVPTMGSWALICLSGLFLSFGLIYLKEEELEGAIA